MVLQSYGIFAIWCTAAWRLKLPHNIAAPACMIGTSAFFERAVALAIWLFGLHSCAALATVVRRADAGAGDAVAGGAGQPHTPLVARLSAWPTTAGIDAQTRLVATQRLPQTLAWASSYDLPAVLAPAMARDLGLAVPMVSLAFSPARVVSALVGPAAGRATEKLGGRPMLLASIGVFALGLGFSSPAQGPLTLFAVWAVLGLAMGGRL